MRPTQFVAIICRVWHARTWIKICDEGRALPVFSWPSEASRNGLRGQRRALRARTLRSQRYRCHKTQTPKRASVTKTPVLRGYIPSYWHVLQDYFAQIMFDIFDVNLMRKDLTTYPRVHF